MGASNLACFFISFRSNSRMKVLDILVFFYFIESTLEIVEEAANIQYIYLSVDMQ